MSSDTHVHIPHPELLPMSNLTAGTVHLLRQTTPTDLRNPVGQHVCRTVEATDRRVPDGSGVALGVIVLVVFFAALGGVAYGLHAAGIYLP